MAAAFRLRSVRPEVMMMLYANRRLAARAVMFRLAAIVVAISLTVLLIALASGGRVPRALTFIAGPSTCLLDGSPVPCS
jgi:hypothetical protein